MITTLVALYNDVRTAHEAVEDLMAHGISHDNVGLVAREEDSRYSDFYFDRNYEYNTNTQHAHSVAGELIQLGLPQHDAYAYGEGVSRGGVLAMAFVADERIDEGVRVLERHDPANVNERTAA